MIRFWLVEDLAELEDGLTVCVGKWRRGGCLFVRNFGVTRPAVLTAARRH